MPRQKIADFSILLQSVRACKLCAGLPLGPNPIMQASAQARILIAGQAPGRIAHVKSRPFDDVSGDRLRAWLGVDRDTFYNPEYFALVPMGFCYPGKGKGGDLPPRPECAPTPIYSTDRLRTRLAPQAINLLTTALVSASQPRKHHADRRPRSLWLDLQGNAPLKQLSHHQPEQRHGKPDKVVA